MLTELLDFGHQKVTHLAATVEFSNLTLLYHGRKHFFLAALAKKFPNKNIKGRGDMTFRDIIEKNGVKKADERFLNFENYPTEM